MKTRHIYISFTLLILTCSGLFGITVSAHAQDVHALLVILGNDREIRDGVEKNEDMMLKMLKQLSDDCTVKLTVMKSKNGYQGEISRITYLNQNSSQRRTTQQDIIESQQVAEWVEDLEPKSQDTVFIYYSGHGEIDSFGTHKLIFDPDMRADTPNRAKISQQLKEKRARLRMLITDTCSSSSLDLPESALKPLASVRERKRQNYLSDLFLKHEGFLDITAASPRQFAIVYDDLGGFFTAALLLQGFTATADTNNDDFLSWQETFNKTKTRTKELYSLADFDAKFAAELRKNRQTTQEPYKHSLPKPIGKGGGSGLPQTIIGQDGAKMVLIPAGKFQMGSNNGEDNEKPVHTVHVDAFYMDIHEVTNAQYKQFIDANPQWRKDRIADRFHDGNYLSDWKGNNYPSGRADHPVVYVSWYAAMAYSQWANKRLPTEAEWEKAARGGLAGKKYPWGNTIDASKANYGWNVDDTTPVRRYAPNAYGLYNMAGNVSEWCLDRRDPNFYEGSPERNPISGGSIQAITGNYKNSNDSRVLRGGSWYSVDADSVRCARRGIAKPARTFYDRGFRCARAVQ